MATAELLMLIGASLFTFALLALVFMLGRWDGEHRAARRHVDWLAAQRDGLAQQRAALGEQRLNLEVQRQALAAQRDRAPRHAVDEEPTREIDISTYGTGPRTLSQPADRPHRRAHIRYEP